MKRVGLLCSSYMALPDYLQDYPTDAMRLDNIDPEDIPSLFFNQILTESEVIGFFESSNHTSIPQKLLLVEQIIAGIPTNMDTDRCNDIQLWKELKDRFISSTIKGASWDK